MTDQPRRILIVRPSALGDVAKSVGALVSLKRAFPNAQVDWLVQDDFVDVIAGHPDLNRALPFPRKQFRRFGFSPTVTCQVLRYLKDLRRSGYDRVYDLQGLHRSGWLTWATRAPHRVGFADAAEWAWLAYNRRHRMEAGRIHAVDRILGLLKADGVEPVCDLRLYTAQKDQSWAQGYLDRNGLQAGGYVVLAPTARWLSKMWPAQSFSLIANRIRSEGLAQACLVVGGSDERQQIRPLLDGAGTGAPCLDLTGQTSVGQLMALIETAKMVLANDSASLHLAVGLGRRAVGIFGPTDPAQVGPYGYGQAVVQPPSGDRYQYHYRRADQDQGLMASIGPEAVWEGIQRVMKADPPRPWNPCLPATAGGVCQP